MKHSILEKNAGLLLIFTLVIISIGGLIEIVPLFYIKDTIEEVKTADGFDAIRPYSPLEQMGRNIYVKEGCYNCHSQMIRPFRAETLRYGHYSVAGESVYDHPFQWGSKRTGPDLAREGGRNSDDWHVKHLINPRSVVPQSNMPAYPWLATDKVDHTTIAAHMRGLRMVGVPYTDEQIAGAEAEVKGKTEMEALIAYLQGLGLALANK